MGYGYYTPEERLLRIAVVVLAIAVIVLGIVAINRCSNTSQDDYSSLYPIYDDDDIDDDIIPVVQPSLQESLSRVMDEPQTINIQSNERYEDCFLRIYPELNRRDKKLGGAKLLGETCADAHGDYKSRSTKDKTCRWPKPKDVGIGLDDSEDGIPGRIDRGEVSVDVSSVDSHGESSWWYVIFGLSITIENLTNVEMDVIIRQGLLLETLGDDVQNIVVRRTVIVHLRAYETQTVRVTAYCASHHRTSPLGYTARITPFYLMAESSVFDSQEAVWQWQEDWYAKI